MFWKLTKYLFVDEMSMLAKDFFVLLSRNASIGKRDLDNSSFGGINVVILGDFRQFPPVARSIQDALYYHSNVETDSLQSQIGRSIYEEFQTVVTQGAKASVRPYLAWISAPSPGRTSV